MRGWVSGRLEEDIEKIEMLGGRASVVEKGDAIFFQVSHGDDERQGGQIELRRARGEDRIGTRVERSFRHAMRQKIFKQLRVAILGDLAEVAADILNMGVSRHFVFMEYAEIIGGELILGLNIEGDYATALRHALVGRTLFGPEWRSGLVDREWRSRLETEHSHQVRNRVACVRRRTLALSVGRAQRRKRGFSNSSKTTMATSSRRMSLSQSTSRDR